MTESVLDVASHCCDGSSVVILSVTIDSRCAYVIASALVAGGAGDQDATLPGVVWLEQISRGRFVRHTLKMGFPRHAAIAAGDYNGDGVMDLAFGNMATTGPMDAWVEVWEGRKK